MKDLVAQARSSLPNIRGSAQRFFEWYHGRYIKTGSGALAIHTMLLVGITGYALEYPHIKHELEHEQAELEKI